MKGTHEEVASRNYLNASNHTDRRRWAGCGVGLSDGSPPLRVRFDAGSCQLRTGWQVPSQRFASGLMSMSDPRLEWGGHACESLERSPGLNTGTCWQEHRYLPIFAILMLVSQLGAFPSRDGERNACVHPREKIGPRAPAEVALISIRLGSRVL